MDGWPNYWPGLPPMWYATHCVGPDARPDRRRRGVRLLLRLRHHPPELVKHYNSPFAVETAHVKLKDSDLTARIIRSLFDVARQYRESIDVYGSKQSFEWTLIEHEPHVLHTAKLPEHKIPKKVKVPDFAAGCRRVFESSRRKASTTSARRPTSASPRARGTADPIRTSRTSSSRALVEGREPYPNAVQVGQLDLRRPLRPRVRAQGRQDREAAGLYASPSFAPSMASPLTSSKPRSTNWWACSTWAEN
jgi:hypothetical protein